MASGIGLRLRQYFGDRSLWIDEASLAINVIQRGTLELISAPLAFDQSAPPGFLIAARGLVLAAGPHDWAIRLLPLVAGTLSTLMALILAQRELCSFSAKATFVGLVALSPILIFYSSEFKQYSSDAFFTLCILVALSYRTTPRAKWVLAATGAIALFGSLPAIFVAVPAGGLLLCDAVRSHEWRQIGIIALCWAAGAALHGLYVWQAGVDRAFMVAWWTAANGFAPFPPDSGATLVWYAKAIADLVYQSFAVGRPAIPGFGRLNWSDPLQWFLTIGFICSGGLAIISRRPLLWVAVASIALTLVVSALQIYPFSSRLLIFLTPLVFLLFSAGVDELNNLTGPAVALGLAFSLVGIVIPQAAQIAAHPVSVSDMRSVVEKIRDGRRKGDAVAVAWKNGRLYQYYSTALDPKLPFFEVSDKNGACFLKTAVKKNGFRRLWFVMIDPLWGSYELRSRKANEIILQVKRTAPIVFEWSAPGTRVVLFDFAAS